MSDFLLWDEDDGVVTLTMNRPDERNALGEESQFAAFEAAMGRINAERSIRVAILTGAGSAFCAGGNLKDMIGKSGMFGGDSMEIRRRYRAGIHRIPRAIERLEVPLIAAVNGPAMGAGCDLACMCDIRVASTTASFGEIFVKLGLIPGDAGCWFLQRVVGYARAAEMALTGDPVSAATALAWGLVSKVVEAETLLGEAKALARRMAVNSSDSVRMAKSLLRQARDTTMDNALELAAAYQGIAHRGEAHDAYLARLAKRK